MKTRELVVWLVTISFTTVTCIPTESKIKAHGVAKRQAEKRGKSKCDLREFQCPNGYCIPASWVCDDEVDCTAGGDEGEPCTECRTFQCNNGQCLQYAYWRCDNYIHCDDYSDERNCPQAPCDGFLCDNGQCLPSSLECDNYADCYDKSDEEKCSGIKKYFSPEAWTSFNDGLTFKKPTAEWNCMVCETDVHISPSVVCDGCLEWYHQKCASLKQAPKSTYWSCRRCHAK